MASPATSPPLRVHGCTNLKLRQTSRLATRHYERHLAALSLKITQYSLLSHVVKLGPVRAGDLAAAMRLSASALSRNLQPLVASGWVEQRASQDDARSRVVQATDAGRAVREQAQQAWKRAQIELNEGLGVERVAALHALLDECMQRLEAMVPAGVADEEA